MEDLGATKHYITDPADTYDKFIWVLHVGMLTITRVRRIFAYCATRKRQHKRKFDIPKLSIYVNNRYIVVKLCPTVWLHFSWLYLYRSITITSYTSNRHQRRLVSCPSDLTTGDSDDQTLRSAVIR